MDISIQRYLKLIVKYCIINNILTNNKLYVNNYHVKNISLLYKLVLELIFFAVNIKNKHFLVSSKSVLK